MVLQRLFQEEGIPYLMSMSPPQHSKRGPHGCMGESDVRTQGAKPGQGGGDLLTGALEPC